MSYHTQIYHFPCWWTISSQWVGQPHFAELGLGSATTSTSRRADKTSTSAIRIQCHLNSPFFPLSPDNPSRHNDTLTSLEVHMRSIFHPLDSHTEVACPLARLGTPLIYIIDTKKECAHFPQLNYFMMGLCHVYL